MMPTPASASSPSAYTILDVDQKAYLFVGGIFGQVKVSLAAFFFDKTNNPKHTLFVSLFLSFRKQKWLERQLLRAAWGRPSWMGNQLDCGTTERGREIVKGVSSGRPTYPFAFTSCVLYFVLVTEEASSEKFPFFSVFSPQRSQGEGTVQLDGEGYAAVGRPTRWNPNVSTVTFKLRTFSSDALLMYLATEDMVCIRWEKTSQVWV